MNCRFCNQELKENDKFCPNCGKKVASKKMIKALIIIIATYALAFFMFFVGYNAFYNFILNYTPSEISEETFIKESEKLGCEVINVLENNSYDHVRSYYVTDKNSCPYLMAYTRFDNKNVMSNYYYSLNSEIKKYDGNIFYTYHSSKLSYNHIALAKYDEYALYVGDTYKNSVVDVDGKTVLYFEVDKDNKDIVTNFKEGINVKFKMRWSFLNYFVIGVVFIIVLRLVSYWKLFVKMGIAGWKGIIPIYNYICFCKASMGKKKYAWLLLIPYVNIIFILILFCNIAKVFGKDTGIQVLTALLPGFMIPLMAFDDSNYVRLVSTNVENNSINATKNNIEEKTKESSLFVKIINWIITIFMSFMLYGCILVAVEDKEYSYYIYSLFVLVLAIMACPLISSYTRRFKKYTKYKKYIVIVLIIIFLILLCSL